MAMCDTESVAHIFDDSTLPIEHRQARAAEFHELATLLKRRYGIVDKNPRDILDIGIGNARVPYLISQIPELWAMVGSYDGIDNSDTSLDLAHKVVANTPELLRKVNLLQADVNHIPLNKQYDLAVLTWFTAGNFPPDEFNPNDYESGSLELGTNKAFQNMVQSVWPYIKQGGELILGSCYLDNDATRKRQENCYRGFGWDVITTELDKAFTATKNGWFSQRFDEGSITEHLMCVPHAGLNIKNLDSYDYAMMVRVKKPGR